MWPWSDAWLDKIEQMREGRMVTATSAPGANLGPNGLFALVAGRPWTVQEKRRHLRLFDLQQGSEGTIKGMVATSR